MSALDGPRAFVVAGIIGEIVAERINQVRHGFTPAHDDAHEAGELASAAACYATGSRADGLWPWAAEWWKPGRDPRRCLVKAAALIVAEIERLDRAAG